MLGGIHSKRARDLFRKVWADPVLSKILGSVGFALLSSSYLSGLFLKGWRLFLILGPLLAAEIFLMWVSRRRPLAIITADPQARYFRRRPRRAATVLAMVLPVLAPIVAWAVGSEICRHDTRISVLVANFEADPQLAHYRVTRTVFEHLRDAVKEFPDVELELLGKSVPWNKNPNSILSWCQKQRNVMLIWGDFDTTREVVVVSAHFRLLNAALPLQAWNDQRSPLGEVEDFTVQDSLSHEFAYLTLLAVGITRFENTDYHSAIKQLTAAIDESTRYNPKAANIALFYRGRAYFETGQFQSAAADFSSVINGERNFPYALNNRGASYAGLGDEEKAYADLSAAIATMPSDHRAYLNRGSVLYKLGRFQESLSDLNLAIRLAPENPQAYEQRANTYDRLNDLDRSLADYAHALRLDGKSPRCQGKVEMSPCWQSRNVTFCRGL
jgi:tetratricopeptide (TPR) repeat protein